MCPRSASYCNAHHKFMLLIALDHSILSVLPNGLFLLTCILFWLGGRPRAALFVKHALAGLPFGLLAVTSVLSLASWVTSSVDLPSKATHLVTAAQSLNLVSSVSVRMSALPPCLLINPLCVLDRAHYLGPVRRALALHTVCGVTLSPPNAGARRCSGADLRDRRLGSDIALLPRVFPRPVRLPFPFSGDTLLPLALCFKT